MPSDKTSTLAMNHFPISCKDYTMGELLGTRDIRGFYKHVRQWLRPPTLHGALYDNPFKGDFIGAPVRDTL